MDIHLGRGNANKLMNRLLYGAADQLGVRVAMIDGGGLRNAIPRESKAEVVVAGSKAAKFKKYIKEMDAIFKAEHSTTDPDMEVVCEAAEKPAAVLARPFQDKLLRAVYACPNGIYRLSPDIAGLTQTSNNLARVLVKDGGFSIQCLTRSSVNSEKEDLADAIKCCLELAGASVSQSGGYPGWTPKPTSAIVKLMDGLYEELYQEKAHVNACHAGLECGILGTNYPEMEMISFGPNIRGAHSPDEKVQISSVQKFWGFLLETLKRV